MYFLNSKPIAKIKVRNGIFAYKYAHRHIIIEGMEYIDYSITEAISKWRSENPYNKGKKANEFKDFLYNHIEFENIEKDAGTENLDFLPFKKLRQIAINYGF
jgi:hypothetical protein